MDKELSNKEFMGRLEHAGILKAVAISRNLEGFRDAKGLRHLVRHWCSALHTFLFSFGKLTVTLEDVVNNFLLPVLGDENPFDINLSMRTSRSKKSYLLILVGLLLLPMGNQPGWVGGL